MKQYESYKDSGIEWIGDIPSHWKVGRLKHYNEVLMGQSPNSEDYSDDPNSLPFLQGNAEFGKYNPSPTIYCDAANKTTIENDVLISVRAPVGAINVSDRAYGIGRGLAAVREQEKFKYNYYFLQISKKYLDSLSTGSTFTAVSIDDLKNIPYPHLPQSEINAINNFLDQKTSLIDDLIAKKQKKIDLLKEKRTALINHAVTKGLNPNVETKDSGVEWIGEIPGHWEIIRIGYIAKLMTGFAFKSDEFDFEQGIKLVRGDNVTEGHLRWGQRARYWNKYEDFLDEYLLSRDDIVIGMDGSKVGKNYAIINESELPLLLVQRVCRLRFVQNVNPRWVYYQIGTDYFKYYINISKTDPMVPHITQKNISDFKVTYPSIEEQNEIVYYIDEQTQLIDSNIDKEQQKIDLLKEYRQSLISEVVTGKIDVRKN